MPLPSFRNSRSRVRRRRSHHALKAVANNLCPKCEAVVLPHRACKKCGTYGARSIAKGMEAVEKTIKKAVKKVAIKKKKTSAEPGHEGHDHE